MEPTTISKITIEYGNGEVAVLDVDRKNIERVLESMGGTMRILEKMKRKCDKRTVCDGCRAFGFCDIAV